MNACVETASADSACDYCQEAEIRNITVFDAPSRGVYFHVSGRGCPHTDAMRFGRTPRQVAAQYGTR